jgi:cytochrome P450
MRSDDCRVCPPLLAMQICGYDVPAGTWICFPGGALDRSTAAYGEDADKFRPDRWISRSSDTGKGGAGTAWAASGVYGGDDAGGVGDQAPAHSELWLADCCLLCGKITRARTRTRTGSAAYTKHTRTVPCRHAVCAGRLKEPVAFSMGPRDCAGQALARLELQVFIAELFSRFRVSLAPGMGSPEEIFDRQIYHVTLSFDGEVLLRMEPR